LTRPRRAGATGHALAVVGAYTALFTWLHARPLVEGGYLAGTDLFDYYLPIFLSPITLWSTYELSGLPALADSQNAAFYPLNLLFGHVFSSWTGYVVSAYVVAASLTYAYVYNRTRSVVAAAVAGLAYGMSEAMLERLEHLTIVHTMAWLPLVVLAIDRLDGRWHPGWVAAGAFGIGSCLLAGHTQPAIYIIYCCALYALAGGIASRGRLPYALAIVTLFAGGALLAAVSALPLWEASRDAVRQDVSFAQFVSHSNTPAQMLTFFVPAIAHEGREAPTYVGLATVVFALVAACGARRQWWVAFWSVIAIVSLLAGAGDATPVTAWLHDVPLYDRFRVVARQLVLAAFGLAVLAGCGIARVRTRSASPRAVGIAATVVAGAVLLVVAALVTAPGAVPLAAPSETGWPSWLPGNHLGAQAVIAAATLVVCVVFAAGRTRATYAALALVALLFVDLASAQPYPLTWSGLQAPVVPGDAIYPSVHARTLRRALEPQDQRALAPAGVTVDPIVPGAFARLWRLPVAGAYGAIQTRRYSQLAAMGTTGGVEDRLFADANSALDVLAVRYLVMDRRELGNQRSFTSHGVEWAEGRLDVPVGPEECGQQHPRTAAFALPAHIAVKRIALVAALRCSESLSQGTQVGTLSIVGPRGERHDVPVRAGHETAEMTLAFAESRRRARHQPAQLFEERADGSGYLMQAELPAPITGGRLEIRLHTPGWLQLHRLTVLDEEGRSVPIGRPDIFLLDGTRWRVASTFFTSRTSDRERDEDVADEQEVVVLENLRARPRAWLAHEVIPLNERDMEIAIHHSLLPDGRPFDSAGMALVDAGEPGAAWAPEGAIVRTDDVEPGRVRVKVTSNAGGFLVLSESFYPGWRARIGDRVVPVRRTNLSLQGVAVPPGDQVVTFEFASFTFAVGAVASTVAAVGLAVLAAWALRRRNDIPASLPPTQTGDAVRGGYAGAGG
jgi:hypothetical protein